MQANIMASMANAGQLHDIEGRSKDLDGEAAAWKKLTETERRRACWAKHRNTIILVAVLLVLLTIIVVPMALQIRDVSQS